MGFSLLAKSDYSNINLVVIGCGNWGKNLIRVIHQLGALGGVCDADPCKAAVFSEEYGVPRYTLQKIINDSSIDAVVIATPSFTHYEIAYLTLNAGKHTFVEKPLALSLEHATELQSLAAHNNKVLMVGHLLQYHSAFQKLKTFVQEDKLGKLQYIYSHRLNLGKFRTEENIWWDYAPHDISMILALTGKLPHTISATGGNFLQHTNTDVTNAQLCFPDNIKAHVFVSWLHPFKEQKMVVVGDKAMVIFNDCAPWHGKLKLYPYPGDWVDGLPHPYHAEAEDIDVDVSEPLLCEAQQFLDSILQQTQPLTNGGEGVNVIQVLHGAIQSMNTQQPYRINNTNLEPSKPLAMATGIA